MENDAFTLDNTYHPRLKKQPVCGTNPNRLQKLLIDDVKWERNQTDMFPTPAPPALVQEDRQA